MFDSNHVQNDFIYQTGGSIFVIQVRSVETDRCKLAPYLLFLFLQEWQLRVQLPSLIFDAYC
jgi:hypothetical protein